MGPAWISLEEDLFEFIAKLIINNWYLLQKKVSRDSKEGNVICCCVQIIYRNCLNCLFMLRVYQQSWNMIQGETWPGSTIPLRRNIILGRYWVWLASGSDSFKLAFPYGRREMLLKKTYCCFSILEASDVFDMSTIV